jgi:YbbR domain-containing protein
MISVLRQLVLKDFRLKIFSLALGILFYVTVNTALKNGPSPMRTLSFTPPRLVTFSRLPVVVMSSAEDVRSFQVQPKEVSVTVQGDARVLESLSAKSIRVLVDITGIETAQSLRKRIEVSTPAGVTHVKVEPEEVQVIFPGKSGP